MRRASTSDGEGSGTEEMGQIGSYSWSSGTAWCSGLKVPFSIPESVRCRRSEKSCRAEKSMDGHLFPLPCVYTQTRIMPTDRLFCSQAFFESHLLSEATPGALAEGHTSLGTSLRARGVMLQAASPAPPAKGAPAGGGGVKAKAAAPLPCTRRKCPLPIPTPAMKKQAIETRVDGRGEQRPFEWSHHPSHREGLESLTLHHRIPIL